MTELALIIPVLILVCLGVVDLLRFSHYKAILQRAASDIAVAARSMPNLDYDLREYNNESGEFYDFRAARDAALANGMAVARSSFTDFGTSSDAELFQVTQPDDALGNYTIDYNIHPPFQTGAAILRPGESATFSYRDDDGTLITDEIAHPTIPPVAGGQLPPQRTPALLERAPIHVEIRARIKPILASLIGTGTIRGVATTYRENGIRRVVMRNANGIDVAPLTATRRGRGSDPVFQTASEPVVPVSATIIWPMAFANSLIRRVVHCGKVWGVDPEPCSAAGL
jgi:hypothetical protein